MKILFFSNLYPPDYVGGYEIGASFIANELTKRGYEVYVLSRIPPNSINVSKVCKEINPKVFRLLASNWEFSRQYKGLLGYLRFTKDVILGVYFNPKNFIISKLILKKLRPDMIAYWNPVGISLSPLFSSLKYKIPIVFHVSDEWMILWLGRSFLLPRTNIHMANIFHMIFFKKLKSRIRIIALSSYIKNVLLKQGFPSDIITVVSYGVDASTFRPLQEEKPNVFTILYAGQIVFHKGVHNVILALAKIVNKSEDAKLLIVGGGDEGYLNYLRRLSRSLNLTDNVVFLGKVPHGELPKIYNKAHVFVYPSIYPEPLGMAILEAMACGIPVIASNIGGVPDIIVNGENGFLVKPNDTSALATILIKLKECPDLLTYIARRGVNTARENFSWGRITEQISLEYEDLVLGNVNISWT